MDVAKQEPSFGELNFGTAQLGDKRRQRRLVRLADQIAREPEGTLPKKLHDPAMYQAMYRLCKKPAVTHAAVLEPHRQGTLERMRQHPRLLLVLHDTTELDYTGKKSLADALGQIGDGGGRGYECHNSLVLDPATGEVLGLANQILHHREDVPEGEGVAACRERESRESRLWVQGSAAVGVPPAGVRWVDVCDRGADTFEFLAYEHAQHREYVVRSKANRSIRRGRPGTAAGERAALLHDHVRGLRAQVCMSARVAAQDGQPARVAKLEVAWTAVWLWPPHVRRGEYEPAPLPCWVVRAYEVQAPAGVEALEWILLTNVPVTTVVEALERISWYKLRPVVEEYHKAQKTGCGIENPQFTHIDRLEPMIALLSVVAVMLLNLRAASRDAKTADQPAGTVVPELWVEVVSTWRYRGPGQAMTVAEFYLALARLGGHQNRSSDGPPGWLTLWRGWQKLHTMIEYVVASRGERSD